MTDDTSNQEAFRADRRALSGSTRSPMSGYEPLGAVDPGERVSATLVLRRRAELPDDVASGARVLDRQELAEGYGADPPDVAAVRTALEAAGVTVTGEDVAARRITVTGSAEALGALFGTTLARVRSTPHGGGAAVEHRQREGELSLPAELSDRVVAVLGLDDRPQSRAQLRIAATGAVRSSYTPVQLGTVYGFPEGTDGTGQTLAIVELGGGYAEQDLTTYFSGLGLPAPKVTSVGVDGGTNGGGTDPGGADAEVLLDIEVAGALAPKASLVVYFAPNTDAGFHDAVATAVHADPTPTAVSISWGGPEDQWTGQARTALDQACADATALGVTVCVAAGDRGSSDGESDGGQHVDFPAASPHVLACGGTTLEAAGGTASSETVWNDGAGKGATGGGVSAAFALPKWQSDVGVPARAGGGSGRGVPDVAGDADPATGYQVLVDGQQQVVGGTSAVAPLWAALVCRLAQQAGRKLGLLQPALYAGVAAGAAAPGFRDVVSGDNGDFAAGPGWDACTGLGVPVGTDLVARVTGA